MNVLDDLKEISRIDKENMLDLLISFPKQCEDALFIGEHSGVKSSYKRSYPHIVFIGVGGSAGLGGRGQGGAHRGHGSRQAGEQLELAYALGQQQVQAGDEPAAGLTGRRGEPGGPRVVHHVKEHRAGAPDPAGERIRGPPGNGRDNHVAVPAGGGAVPGDHPQGHPEPGGERTEPLSGLRPADVDRHHIRAEVAGRGSCRGVGKVRGRLTSPPGARPVGTPAPRPISHRRDNFGLHRKSSSSQHYSEDIPAVQYQILNLAMI